MGKMTKPVPSPQQSWRAVHSAGESRRQLIKPHTQVAGTGEPDERPER